MTSRQKRKIESGWSYVLLTGWLIIAAGAAYPHVVDHVHAIVSENTEYRN